MLLTHAVMVQHAQTMDIHLHATVLQVTKETIVRQVREFQNKYSYLLYIIIPSLIIENYKYSAF